MITAAYTICKNEIKRIERWFQYAEMFDYIVVLDTGSSDGTVSYLRDKHHENPTKVIVQQRIFTPFQFDIARNYNLNMIPDHVEWALSPDIDEWFSINVLVEMQKIIKEHPDVTNITTTRLDIYSPDVFVGPPDHIPTNKIHKRHHYIWKQPIYEHLWPKDLNNQKEVYSDKIFLIHDQDTSKSRSSYHELMAKRFHEDPTDCWNNWYLLKHYYREKDMTNYIQVALMFLKYSKTIDDNYREVYNDISNIYKYYSNILQANQIKEALDDLNVKL